MRSIYIILTCSTSIPSRVIGLFTHEPFTHVSIAFESDLNVMYSFARLYSAMPLPAGLTEEHLDCGFYKRQGDIPCAILRLDVPDRVFFRIKDRVYRMLQRRRDYRYSMLGLIMCKLNIPLELPNRFFCSQFVGSLLNDSGALTLPKPASLMHPSDFRSVNGLTLLYDGGLSELRAEHFLPLEHTPISA